MIEYENPPVPDHMNRSRTNPLWDFFLLALMAIGGLVAVVAVVLMLGGMIGSRIPFSWELSLVRSMGPIMLDGKSASEAPVEQALQQLADRLSRQMDLPAGMEITVHYDDSDIVNAQAGIGGQLVIYGGLLRRVKSENELAMVVAHEIAHIKHRDVAKAMGGGLLLSLGYGMVFGNEGSGADLIRRGVELVQLDFSRKVEAAADAEALKALARDYGHVNGATDLFRTLDAANREELGDRHARLMENFEMLQSHPSIQHRIEAIEAEAKQLGVRLDGPKRPLPAVLARLAEEKSAEKSDEKPAEK